MDDAPLNFWARIRDGVLCHFASQDIAWHDDDTDAYGPRRGPGPSPHLLDSQVCALNFWWGLSQSPSALAAVLRTAFPDLHEVAQPCAGGPLLEPEWMGLRNHLGEVGRRRRGRCATSADLLAAYVDRDGRRHGVLIESKYTEDYSGALQRRFGDFGRDRFAIYAPHVAHPEGPFRHDLGFSPAALLVEPFDQHLRQQLLARAMEREGELAFQTVTCLHVAPRANTAFHQTITAAVLDGPTVADAWRRLLREPTRYRSVAYEDLFAVARTLEDEDLAPWTGYIADRYGW